MKTRHLKKPGCILWAIFVWAFILACSATYRPVDPTRIVPDDLSGMDFSFQDMPEVDLSGKNLRGVDFTYADLRGADLSNTDCTGAIFDYAELRGADFTGAILDEKWERIIGLLTSGDGSGQNFEEYDLRNTQLAFYDFSGADLKDAELDGANLSSANLNGADLILC